MADGIEVAKVGDIADGEGLKVSRIRTGTLDDIAVFNDGGAFFALDDTCSHEEASLSQGWVEDGTVECPLHAACFSLKDGAVLSLPATKGVAAHRVEIVGDAIVVHPAADRLA
ncbi:MAG: bifunctional 3-phenylpropionate/cinnamic acid dioxygenase ferredoxin subunit [Microbacteriaceae bacterium]|nr:bifunctional 3-phenylpropionate/cinnamic acid dioxygenase ferredoxin subunit [Microbacteriaceae bacterium]